MERINKENAVLFTNDASLLRLVVSILIDINEGWITGNLYFLSVKLEMISLDTGSADYTL
jgi:hypothetical protein